ncbi:MAG: beta-lactamase family protein [Cyclobacteriaceae bacterium]|nr:beta-lactamase family protein [Cyclobacteriaceae bacterium]
MSCNGNSLRHYPLLLFSLGCFLINCSAESSSFDQAPKFDDWEQTSPEAAGIEPLVIDSIHQEILEGKYGLIDHFILIRKGKVVMDHHYEQDYQSVIEKYDTTNHQYNYDHVAWHPYYKDTNLHTLQSVTKSVTSILLGIAADQGKISEASPVMSHFAAYDFDRSDARKMNMSIKDLLTMRSGIEWDEENYNEANNSCILMENSQDWIQFVLNHPMDATPGSSFEYNSGASVLLGKIVREITGKRIDHWAEEKLFGPLGIEDYYWKFTPKGEIDTEGGLYLSAHDLARIGHLMLQKGKWGDQQILSEDWVDKSIQPTVAFGEERGYGYQWWVPKHMEGKAEIFAGNGYGGQFLMVVPRYELVLVFNGWNIHDQPEKSTWRVLQERILPAIQAGTNN